MRLDVRIAVMGAATLGLACAPKVVPVQPAATFAPVAARQLTTASLVGIARAPLALAGAESLQGGVLVGDSSKIITNDGAGLIGNDGGGLIGNDGASLKLLQAPDDLAELPLAGAVALARDARTQALLKAVKPATTDAKGQFTLKGLPADVTVMVEIVFVAKGAARALRMASLAHVDRQPAAQPVPVTLATTLATAELTKDAASGSGQIYLLKQQDIQATATTIQAAIDKDADRKREAAQAIAVPTDAKGAVAVSEATPASPLATVTAAADKVVESDTSVAQTVQTQRDTLTRPVPVELQPLVTAAGDATKATATPEPGPSPSSAPMLASDGATPLPVATRLRFSPEPIATEPSPSPSIDTAPSPTPVVASPRPTATPLILTRISPAPLPTTKSLDVIKKVLD